MAEQKSTAAELRARLEIARLKFALADLSENSRSGYGFDWRAFVRWCKAIELESFPASAETVALHLTDMLCRGLKVTSVRRRAAGIAHVHRSRDAPNPVTNEIQRLMRGARRTRIDDRRQVRPLSIEELRQISVLLEGDGRPIAYRDRAIMVAGFASALRSASLALLQLSDVEWSEQGITLRIRKEKQDQEGKGRLIGLPHGKHPETCPARCLNEWIDRRGSQPGPLFVRFDNGWVGRHAPLVPERFSTILKRCVKRIGLDASQFGSHSLRSGFITAAGMEQIGDWIIASQSGHASMTCLKQYFRRRDIFKSNACALLDL